MHTPMQGSMPRPTEASPWTDVEEEHEPLFVADRMENALRIVQASRGKDLSPMAVTPQPKADMPLVSEDEEELFVAELMEQALRSVQSACAKEQTSPRVAAHQPEADVPITDGEGADSTDEQPSICVAKRMEQAFRSVNASKGKGCLRHRPSKFSMKRQEEQLDPFSCAFSARTPQKSNITSQPKVARSPKPFTATKLGIPIAQAKGSASLGEQDQQKGSAVRYLHIPMHDLTEIRNFAQLVADEAIIENNPSVHTLSSHRAKLHTPLFDTPRTVPTAAQQMACDPSSLGRLHNIDSPFRFTMEDEFYGPAPTSRGFLSTPFASCGSCHSQLWCDESA